MFKLGLFDQAEIDFKEANTLNPSLNLITFNYGLTLY